MTIRSIIVGFGCLLASLSISADNMDELARIKQNYSNMIVPSGKDPSGLLSILSSITPEEEMSDQVVVELHQRYPFNLKKIESYLSTITDVGKWLDINYADQKRSGWEPKVHAERILELVKLYYSKQTSYYQSSKVENSIHKALAYWFATKPVCSNWWYNQIGIPKTLGTAFVLFEDKLTSDEKEKAIKIMENAKFGMTGQNKVWLAGNVMMRALLQNDYTLVKMARDTIVSEIMTGGAEGIKDDWCFHQHGAQQQFGNYGLSFVSSMSFFSGLLAGTSMAFDKKQLGIISNLIDKGYRWIIWKGMMDVNALGRQLFHHSQVHKALSLAFAASELGGGESEECNSVATSLLRDNYPPASTTNLTGNKHFWQSDYTIHRRPHWMASVKMASERVIGAEMMNGDNMKGFYLADGATYIYKDGKEYLDIFPLWDWRKLPGVTALQSEASMPVLTRANSRNKATFVGGVSNGVQGMSVMDLDRAGVKEHKAWVFTNDFVLCLGAGIQSDSSLVVTTSIEQCYQRGEMLSWNKDNWDVVNAKNEIFGKEHRFFHDHTGYIVWGNSSKVVSGVEKRMGRWHDVMQMYRPEEVEGEIASLYLDHGVAPMNSTYQYLILPAVEKSRVSSFDLSSVNVICNNSNIQAVHMPVEGMWWIAAYQPNTINLAKGFTLDIVTPGIYMIKETASKKYIVYYADPTQQKDFMEIVLGGKKVGIALPEGKNRGQTTFMEVKL